MRSKEKFVKSNSSIYICFLNYWSFFQKGYIRPIEKHIEEHLWMATPFFYKWEIEIYKTKNQESRIKVWFLLSEMRLNPTWTFKIPENSRWKDDCDPIQICWCSRLPRTQDVNWTYIRRSVNILCPGGRRLIHKLPRCWGFLFISESWS